MGFSRATFVALATSAALVAAQDCPKTWTCRPATTAPTLDGDLSDWQGAGAIVTPLQNTVGTTYADGSATYKCLYDSEKIYFSLEIPGRYRYSADSNHLCASVATMFKIGSEATLVNMGGCPDGMGGCDATGAIPDTCMDYRVDIGGHWELAGTEAGTFYGMTSNTQRSAGAPDFVDQYGVSPYCKMDDDGANAANEWDGAWSHTNPTEGEDGTYIFEMARPLTTASNLTDAQLTAGETYQFGIAFWDPYTKEDVGWDDIDHYVTGCAQSWIDLELGPEGTGTDATPAAGNEPVSTSTGGTSSTTGGSSSTGGSQSKTSGATSFGIQSMTLAVGALFAALA